MNRVDIADLDCIFLTYDEPLKEEFWVQIKNTIPWAVRVDGVKGSDAAHKAAAEASTTERFVLIDGDNIPDWDFFNQTLEFESEQHEHAVYRWRARNIINGLMYGNGGLSCWTRTFVQSMKTHEASDGSNETCVEFCFDPLYWAMHDCYSTTYPNGSPFQAWRAGFREGVKMCLDRGRRPSVQQFKESVHKRNLDHLTIWHNIGADADFGHWATLGARMGTHQTMLTGWDYRQVQDFSYLQELWENYKDINVDEHSAELGNALSAQLGLPIVQYDRNESEFFKHHYLSAWQNKGIMARE